MKLVPEEPPYGLVVELLPATPGLFWLDPLELLLGLDPRSEKIPPPLDPGLLLLDPLELLDPPEKNEELPLPILLA